MVGAVVAGDGQVQGAVLGEVADGQVLPEGGSLPPRGLRQGGPRAEAVRRSPDDGDRADALAGADGLRVRSDDEVGVAVPVQVAGGHGSAEPVAGLGHAGDAGRVLVDDGPAGGGEAARGAVQHDDGSRLLDAAHRGVGGADHQVPVAVAVQVVVETGGGGGRGGGGGQRSDEQGGGGEQRGGEPDAGAGTHGVPSPDRDRGGGRGGGGPVSPRVRHRTVPSPWTTVRRSPRRSPRTRWW